MFLLILTKGAMNVIDHRITRAGQSRKDNMTAFTIDAENNITVFASLKEIQGSEEGTETFTNQEGLAALADKWPGGRLVEIWNSLPGVQPVERFTSRRVAVARIWKAIQHLKPTGAAQSQPVGLKKGSAKKKATHKQRGKDTKIAKILALLKQPAGASLKTLMADASYCTHLAGCERFSIGPASFR
jgi:hypothetical protein